jgi:hypothetical protein
MLKDAEGLKALAARLYGDHHTRKPDYYFDIFVSYLDAIREQPLAVLELGVFTGASLLIWREYLPNARIVGLDLKEMPEELAPQVAAGAVAFVQGDQASTADLQRCLDQTPHGKFDVIIDDASHRGAPSRASFDFLFTHGLTDRGLYFVEDFGTGYSPWFGGAAFTPPPPLNMEDNVFPSHDVGMVGWLKQLVDEVTVRVYMDPDKTITRPVAACHFWPNLALVEKL